MIAYPRPVGAVLVAAIALAGSGCVINVDADEVVVREEKRFTVGAGAEVTIETFDGSIRVQSWSQPEIRVEAEKRGPDRETAAALEVRATQEGNSVRVEAPGPQVRQTFIGLGNSSPSVSFIVRVPESVNLTALTRDGSIVVEDVRGTVNLKSNDGSIRAEQIIGDITARTDDGSVTLSDVNGPLALQSGDGSIRVDGRIEALRARTRDGSIVVDADNGSSMKDDWEITTGDGSITFHVPQDFSAEIDADSRDGRVRSDFKGLESTRGEHSDRGTLRGRIGSGGHKITLRSGDGSISVLSR